MDYREKIVHGDEGLPFAVYSVTPSHVRYHMELHWHPEHEILFVQDGTFSLRLNDTVYLPVSYTHLALPTKLEVYFSGGGGCL